MKEFIANKKLENNELISFKRESGKCIDYYLYNKMPLIIFGLIKCKNKKNLENINLFIGPSLMPLNKKIEEIASFQESEKKEENKMVVNLSKIKMNKENNTYEDIGDKFWKLSKDERTKLLHYLYHIETE